MLFTGIKFTSFLVQYLEKAIYMKEIMVTS
jgi:hypothetical protein